MSEAIKARPVLLLSTSRNWAASLCLFLGMVCLWGGPISTAMAGELTIETHFTYNENGALQTRTAADGVVTTYNYDPADRLTSVTYSNGLGEVSPFVYNDLDLLTSLTDETGTTTYYYEPEFYNLERVESPNAHQLHLDYDAQGALVEVYVDSQNGENYSYDQEGRLQRVFTETGTTTLNYDPDTGQLQSKQLGNGVFLTYTYYPETGELESMLQTRPDGSLIAEYTYSYYPNGLLQTVTEETAQETRSITYQYDELFRLTQANYQPENRQENYSYDANGNRLRKWVTVDGEIVEDTRYRYNGLNQIAQAGNEIFYHDAKGNIKRRINLEKETEYYWDNENQLIRVEESIDGIIAKTVEYAYNGLGERIQKTLTVEGQTTTTDYVNSAGTAYEPLAIYENGNLKAKRLLLSDTYIEEGIYRYYLPGPGGVARIVNEAGIIEASYEYDAFGNILEQTGSFKNPYTYNGEHHDLDTGLIFLRNRYYDPKLGRFLSIDPHPGFLYSPQTLNPYVYVHNDPVNFVDPLGLCEEQIREVFDITVTSFIAEPTVNLFGLSGTTFKGDNRDIGESGTFRTTQSITIDTNSPSLVTNTFKDTGFTHQIDPRTGSIIATAKASDDTLSFDVSQNLNETIIVNFSGNEKNPLTPQFFTPGITYDISVVIDPKTGNVSLEGSHDPFPAFEVIVNGEVLHGNIGTNLLGLLPLFPNVDVGNN